MSPKLLENEKHKEYNDNDTGCRDAWIQKPEPFDGRRDTDRWCYKTVRHKCATSDDRGIYYPSCFVSPHQCIKSKNSSFALVVSVQCQVDVFDCCYQRQRPEHA